MDIEYWIQAGLYWNLIIKALWKSDKVLTIRCDKLKSQIVIEIGDRDIFFHRDIQLADLEELLSYVLEES